MATTVEYRSSFTIPAAILGLSLIVSTLAGGWYVAKVKAQANTIAVTGSAQKTITSDVAKWHVALSRSTGTDTVKDGYAQIQKDLAMLMTYMKKNGIDPKAVTVGAIAVDPVYSQYADAKGPSGYTVRQEVTVESGDVQKLTQTAQNAGSLLADGALLTTTSLEYFYSKIAEVKLEMLAQATKNAQERARKIAQSAGAGLGTLKDASMGVMQITAVNSTEVSDYGTYDTSSVEKQITAIVRASFGVR
jgi:hypothetical protein